MRRLPRIQTERTRSPLRSIAKQTSILDTFGVAPWLLGLITLGLFALAFLSRGSVANGAEARISTGDLDPNREAQRYVESALDAAAQGDAYWHAQLIEEALKVAPDYAPARWQTGHVLVGKKWLTIKEAENQAATDKKLLRYHELRTLVEKSPQAHERLARWCRRNGLTRRERLHWYHVLQNNPQNKDALACLGVRWYQGDLLRPAEIEQRKKEAATLRRAQQRINRKIATWIKDLEIGTKDIGSKNTDARAKRYAILDEIRAIDDVRAIPVIESELSGSDSEISLAIVESLSRLDDPLASQSLARHAVLSPFEPVRKAATVALADRSIFDFFPMLLGELKLAVQSDFVIRTAPDGDVRYVHEIVDESAEATRVMTIESELNQIDTSNPLWAASAAAQPASPIRSRNPNFFVGRPQDIAREKSKTVASANRLFANQALKRNRDIQTQNQTREQVNQRIIETLTELSDQAYGEDIRGWWAWWREHNDLYVSQKPVYEDKRSYVETKRYTTPPPKTYYPVARTQPVSYRAPRSSGTAPPARTTSRPVRSECFIAGTPVWTQTGKRPIESIKPGDWVLAQDINSGEITYKPVFDTTLRPEAKILKIRVQGQTISSTLGHPFWVEGKGWRMAKELKPGDSLHTVAGPAKISSITESEKAEAFNLVVADFGNYFVGKSGILVHDNVFREPTRAIVPGLVVKQATK